MDHPKEINTFDNIEQEFDECNINEHEPEELHSDLYENQLEQELPKIVQPRGIFFKTWQRVGSKSLKRLIKKENYKEYKDCEKFPLIQNCPNKHKNHNHKSNIITSTITQTKEKMKNQLSQIPQTRQKMIRKKRNIYVNYWIRSLQKIKPKIDQYSSIQQGEYIVQEYNIETDDLIEQFSNLSIKGLQTQNSIHNFLKKHQ